MEDRIKLSRSLQISLERLGLMPPEAEKDELWREVKVLKAKWEAGL